MKLSEKYLNCLKYIFLPIRQYKKTTKSQFRIYDPSGVVTEHNGTQQSEMSQASLCLFPPTLCECVLLLGGEACSSLSQLKAHIAFCVCVEGWGFREASSLSFVIISARFSPSLCLLADFLIVPRPPAQDYTALCTLPHTTSSNMHQQRALWNLRCNCRGRELVCSANNGASLA
jgi:hypothetical protein